VTPHNATPPVHGSPPRVPSISIQFLPITHHQFRTSETFLGSNAWYDTINLNEMATMVSIMANLSAKPSRNGNVEIDHRTSLAVCDGIGERLRDLMKPTTQLPHRLEELMNRLREVEDAPSITPGAGLFQQR